jgi:hypothetical protein
MIEADCPNNCQGIRDQVFNLMQVAGLQVAFLKGKSNITEAKQRICAGAASAVASAMSIAKGKGAPRRIETCWPDMRNEWRLVVDGNTIASGALNTTNMQLEIEVAIDIAGSEMKAQEIAHCIREWERSDRIGYLLYPHITLVTTLSNCVFGRAPKNLGKGQPPTVQAAAAQGKGVFDAVTQGKGAPAAQGKGTFDPWAGQQLGQGQAQQGRSSGSASNDNLAEARRAEQQGAGWPAPAERQLQNQVAPGKEAAAVREAAMEPYNYANSNCCSCTDARMTNGGGHQSFML